MTHNPLGSAGSIMPPPLSAIITPRVSSHEGNNSRSVPKYLGMPVQPHVLDDDEVDDKKQQPHASSNHGSSNSLNSSSLSSAGLNDQQSVLPGANPSQSKCKHY